MDTLRAPYKLLLLVCTHLRQDGRAACGLQGSEEILRELKRRVGELDLPILVRVTRTGCLDLCGMGPAVLAYPSGRLYAGVRPEDVDRILQDLLGEEGSGGEPLA
jgi:(2Fe-2S) ferredoxin